MKIIVSWTLLFLVSLSGFRFGSVAAQELQKSNQQENPIQAIQSQSKSSDRATLDKLKSLVGKWKRSSDDKNEFVEYRMTARDSVLVETWTWPDKGSEALTLYHLDGDKLMATHYCPIGNQPRLLLDSKGDDSKILFKFDSITNLPDRTVSHCVEFWIEPHDQSSFTRSETYTEKDGLDIGQATYERVEPSKQ